MAASGLLNLFQIVAPKPAAPSSATAAFTADESPRARDAGRKFARMVDDASPRDTSARDTANARSAAAKSAAANNRDRVADAPAVQRDLRQEITPEEAADMLANFDEIATSLADLTGDSHAGDQLKQQLAEIVASNQSQPVDAVLAQVEELSPEALAALTDASVLPEQADATATLATLGQTAQHVFQSIRKALSHRAEESPSQDVNAEASALLAVNPALLALQAATFQAAPVDAAQASEASASAEETLTVITPLSQSAILRTMQRAEVDAVESAELPAQEELPAQVNLENRIPSLAIAKNDNDLPEVELPRTNLPLQATTDARAKHAAMPTSEFVRQIETLGVSAQALVDARENIQKEDVLPAVSVSEAKPVSAPSAFTLSAHGVAAPAPLASASEVLGRGVVNHAPVREQVSVAIRQAAGDGADQITVQLDPVELGRIEIKLHMHKDGATQLLFLVDKPETFDALSRDARMLEQSLQESGIKADTSGMQFNLRQQPQPQQMQGGSDGQHGSQHGPAPEQDNNAPASRKPDIEASAAPVKNYRLDIRDGVDIEA